MIEKNQLDYEKSKNKSFNSWIGKKLYNIKIKNIDYLYPKKNQKYNRN